MEESYDKGIGSLFLDYLRGDVQSQGDIRYSAGLADRYGDDVSDDRKSTRLNSSHGYISYAVFCLKKKRQQQTKKTTLSAKPTS